MILSMDSEILLAKFLKLFYIELRISSVVNKTDQVKPGIESSEFETSCRWLGRCHRISYFPACSRLFG